MLQTKSPISLNFKVYRRTPELVTPAKPTANEFKLLSDFENVDSFKIQFHGMMVFPHKSSMNDVDPADVIRKAIAETLVFYYPFAGRLRKNPSGKLVVECNGEGVLFTEAYADVTLDQIGYPIAPPFPCLDQLHFNFPAGSSEIFNSPLLRVQFVFAIGEMARGATSPSVLPIWERHILNFKNPQKLTSPLLKSSTDISDDGGNNDLKFPPEHDLCYRAFFFEPTEISALKRCVPRHLRHCSSYEILIASAWKCRIIAFQPHPMEESSLIWSVNFRSKLKLPPGYYGNAALIQISMSTAKEIIENPLSYTLQLVKNVKDKVIDIEDFPQTVPNMKVNRLSYNLADWRYAGNKIDFGWGKSIYSGGADYCGPIDGCHMSYKTKNGENGIMLTLCMPKQVMERFEKQLNNMLKDQPLPFRGDDEDVVQSKL